MPQNLWSLRGRKRRISEHRGMRIAGRKRPADQRLRLGGLPRSRIGAEFSRQIVVAGRVQHRRVDFHAKGTLVRPGHGGRHHFAPGASRDPHDECLPRHAPHARQDFRNSRVDRDGRNDGEVPRDPVRIDGSHQARGAAPRDCFYTPDRAIAGKRRRPRQMGPRS